MRSPHVSVVEATPAQHPSLAVVLALAFVDDPLVCWLMPSEPERFERLTHFFTMELRLAERRGVVLTTTDGGAAALWYPPQQWKMSTPDILRSMPLGLRAFGSRNLIRALRVMTRMEAVHLDEPHWYLSVIGTEPASRGRGAGGELIRAVTDRCDAQGLPAYLESSKESNLPYYHRFGFEVVDEIPTPGGGPMQWSMRRDP